MSNDPNSTPFARVDERNHAAISALARTPGHNGYVSEPPSEQANDHEFANDVDTFRLVIIDDHSLVREGTSQLLNQELDFNVVGQASTAEAGLGLIERLKPDIALVDVSLPGMSGLELTREIVSRGLEVKILILSAYDDYAYVAEALDVGVAGYMLKTATGRELVDAIRAVLNGVFVLDSTVSARLSRHWRHETRDAVSAETLTPRESDVLRLLARGMSNKQVASQLSLGLRTVEGHVSNILAKLGVSSRTEAVLKALGTRGIITDDNDHSRRPR